MIGLAATAALLVTGAAVLGSADDRAVTVRVDDLDLAAPAGARVALLRARSAAEAFCGGADRTTEEGRDLASACRAEMTGRAVAAMHAPLVAAMRRAPAVFQLAGA
jgi:UrcA family protein